MRMNAINTYKLCLVIMWNISFVFVAEKTNKKESKKSAY